MTLHLSVNQKLKKKECDISEGCFSLSDIGRLEPPRFKRNPLSPSGEVKMDEVRVVWSEAEPVASLAA